MLPAAFDYIRPTNIQEALRALAEYGEEGKILAGGQSLIPLLKLRFAFPRVLIDINRIPELEYVRFDGDRLCIGARTRQAHLATAEVVRERAPIIPAVIQLHWRPVAALPMSILPPNIPPST
jgi:CO/xanthine dehydrogenase FAD-binding subunit